MRKGWRQMPSILDFDSYSTKRVSYILTTKDRAKYLDKALNEYRKLIKPEDELIIVDGASKDKTSKIIAKYSDMVDVFVSEPDIGGVHALNKGILLARGKYIKNLTDDDEIYPEAMEKAIKVLEKHAEVDVLVCGGTKQHGPNYSVFYLPKGVNYGQNIKNVIKYGACGVGFIIKRKSLAISGLFPLGLAGDVNFIMKCIWLGLNVKFCRINLFNHPVYSHSTVVSKAKEHEKDFNKSLSTYAGKGFYYRYRIKKIFYGWPRYTEKLYRSFPLTKTLLFPVRFLYKRLSRKKLDENIFNNKDLRKMMRSKRYIWDGGFS